MNSMFGSIYIKNLKKKKKQSKQNKTITNRNINAPTKHTIIIVYYARSNNFNFSNKNGRPTYRKYCNILRQ